MSSPSEQQSNAVATMEASEAQLRDRVETLRADRRAATHARIAKRTEEARQRRLERLAGSREPVATATTRTAASPATPSASKKARTKEMWRNALNKPDDTAQPSGKSDGIDRRALWKRALSKGE